jgi:heme-degrading monooxygenase HmoA
MVTVVRIWRTKIDPGRAGEYRQFVNEDSLPMFRKHEGFVGVVFAGVQAERIVITFWRNREAVEALNRSPIYRKTGNRIENAGFIVGPSTVEAFDVEAASLPGLPDETIG